MKLEKENLKEFCFTANRPVDAWVAIRNDFHDRTVHVDAFIVTEEYAYGHIIEEIDDNKVITGIDEELCCDLYDGNIWINESYTDLMNELDAYDGIIAAMNEKGMKLLEQFCTIMEEYPDAELDGKQRMALRESEKFKVLRSAIFY